MILIIVYFFTARHTKKCYEYQWVYGFLEHIFFFISNILCAMISIKFRFFPQNNRPKRKQNFQHKELNSDELTKNIIKRSLELLVRVVKIKYFCCINEMERTIFPNIYFSFAFLLHFLSWRLCGCMTLQCFCI